MTFPILKATDLPAIGTSSERSDLDFKVKPTTSRIGQAKDVAALASTIGGSIIVGAATKGMVLSSYLGIPSADAEKLPNQYEQSVKDRCRPSPRIASEVTSTTTPLLTLLADWGAMTIG